MLLNISPIVIGGGGTSAVFVTSAFGVSILVSTFASVLLAVAVVGVAVGAGVVGFAVAFTGGAFVTVQSAFKVAPLGVVVQVGGARLSDCCHTAGRVPACISHATFAWLFASTCLLSIGVVGAGAIGVIAGATHATGAFAIGAGVISQ